jgi:hypothetical protein
VDDAVDTRCQRGRSRRAPFETGSFVALLRNRLRAPRWLRRASLRARLETTETLAGTLPYAGGFETLA